MPTLVQSLIRERKEQQRILYERERRDEEARRDGIPVVDEHAERVRDLSALLEHFEARKLLGEDLGHELRAARDELEAAKYHAERGTPLATARVEDALGMAKAEAEAEAEAVRESSLARQDVLGRYRAAYIKAEEYRLAMVEALADCEAIANEVRALLRHALSDISDIRAQVREQLGIAPVPKPLPVRLSADLGRIERENSGQSLIDAERR